MAFGEIEQIEGTLIDRGAQFQRAEFPVQRRCFLQAGGKESAEEVRACLRQEGEFGGGKQQAARRGDGVRTMRRGLVKQRGVAADESHRQHHVDDSPFPAVLAVGGGDDAGEPQHDFPGNRIFRKNRVILSEAGEIADGVQPLQQLASSVLNKETRTSVSTLGFIANTVGCIWMGKAARNPGVTSGLRRRQEPREFAEA